MIEHINLNETPSLKQLVYDHLLRQIVSGRLPPNTRLLEAEIASAMNVSRAPIREALNMLERDGFTRIIPYKGSVVAEVTAQNVHEIWEIRCLLEPYVAKVSCKSIPRERLYELSERLNKLEQHPEDFDEYTDSDCDVHSILYEYHDNNYMKDILSKLKTHSVRMRWIERQTKNPEACLASIREHQVIVDALLEGDPDKIYTAVYNHIKDSQNRVMEEIAAYQKTV